MEGGQFFPRNLFIIFVAAVFSLSLQGLAAFSPFVSVFPVPQATTSVSHRAPATKGMLHGVHHIMNGKVIMVQG